MSRWTAYSLQMTVKKVVNDGLDVSILSCYHRQGAADILCNSAGHLWISSQLCMHFKMFQDGANTWILSRRRPLNIAQFAKVLFSGVLWLNVCWQYNSHGQMCSGAQFIVLRQGCRYVHECYRPTKTRKTYVWYIRFARICINDSALLPLLKTANTEAK